jgi:hypothetical protein
MSGFSFSHGLGFYSIDRSALSNENVLPISSVYQVPGQVIPNTEFLSSGYVGINNSNPAYALDVFGDIRASGNLYSNGNTLSFLGIDPIPGYTNLITADASGELSIAGYTTNPSNYSRKVVVYENLYVAGGLTQQNNAGTNYSFSQTGSNGNGLQLCQSYGTGAYSDSANPGDSVIRTQGTAQLFLQNGSGNPAMSLSNNVVTFYQQTNLSSVVSAPFPARCPILLLSTGTYTDIKPGTVGYPFSEAGSSQTHPYFPPGNAWYGIGLDNSSSTLPSYTYARLVIRSFCTGTSNVTNTVSMSLSGSTFESSNNTSGGTFNVHDYGNNYGFCTNMTQWFSIIGSPAGFNAFALSITNNDSTRTVRVGNSYLQFGI